MSVLPPSIAGGRGPGVFVAIAGPSGAGKDSLIRAGRERLAADPRIVFARRVVTRTADASEEHDTLDPATFRQRAAAGAFALWWEANGLLYGLPAAILADLATGRIVVGNISRDVIDVARRRFARTLVVHVTASAEVLTERLAARGRESADERAQRLSRSLLREQAVEADVRIENNGDLADAAARLAGIIAALTAGRPETAA